MVESEPVVDAKNGEPPGASRIHRAALVATYLGAAVLGYGLTAWGPFGGSGDASGATPLARVGYALREEKVAASPEAWASLRNDVMIVRSAWNPEQLPIFDLVVAVRGLNRGGTPDWEEAERLCRALSWPRCDRPALEALKQRSRP
ncbi:MAG: hypothetical protein DIU78_000645 [Pseudomonadota bacterium]|nr:MAG: hypothetical protein DIU78_12885 [Pseudomonadota bacterium]